MNQFPSRRAFIGGSAAAAALVAGGAAGASAKARRTGPSAGRRAGWTTRPVRIESGLVAGVPALLPGVTVYKGIPYGASTAGDGRWRPPRPAPRWDGVRVADTWGDACVQDTSMVPAGQVPGLSEDCLNLNVWTAAGDPGERRPVLIWAYGGRDSAMWASQPLYDGAGLARKGLVVVTFNRRVGPFGGLATPQLTAESGHDASGNYVLMDTIAALQWIQRNIHAFGGDPDRVTLGGWSAGSACTWDLACSPLARGLFSRGLAESGLEYTKDPALSHLAGSYITLDAAQEQGTALMQALGVSTSGELRALPASTVQAVGGDIGSYVLDGWVLPRGYTETLALRAQNDVPFIAGNTKDENNAWLAGAGGPPPASISLAMFQAGAQAEFGARAADFLALYPAATDDEANAQAGISGQDDERISTFLWGTQWRAAGRAPAYTYFFTHTPPGTDTANPVVPGNASGAYHGSDIYYFLDNLYGTPRPWQRADYQIADTLSSYLVNFAAAGDPNGRGLTRWPAVDPGRRQVMAVGDSFGVIPIASDAARQQFFTDYFESQTTAW